MNRRNFLRSLVGGVAVGAAVRTWPFRVYSFPSEPKLFTGDFIIAYDSNFFNGQMIAAYSPDGGLCRGVYRVLKVDAERREITMTFEPPQKRDLVMHPSEADNRLLNWDRLTRRA